MGPCNEVGAQAGAVVLHLNVAHRDRGHVQPQRLPIGAVIKRDPDLCVCRGIEEPAYAAIFPDRVGDGVGRDAGVDLGPRPAAVVRAPEMRMHVVDAQRVRGGIGGQRIEVARLDVEDAGPRLNRGRGHVFPRRPAIQRHLDVAVVGARPQDRAAARRRRQRGDCAAGRRRHVLRIAAGTRRHRPALPSKIGADSRPAVRMIDRLPHDVGRVVQHARVQRRPDERHRAHIAAEAVAALGDIGTDRRRLARAAIVARDVGARAPEHHIGIARIGRRDAVLLNVGRVPVVERDLAVVGAARHAEGTRVLLAAAHAIRERIVRRHVIDGRRRLRVPVAP